MVELLVLLLECLRVCLCACLTGGLCVCVVDFALIWSIARVYIGRELCVVWLFLYLFMCALGVCYFWLSATMYVYVRVGLRGTFSSACSTTYVCCLRLF